MSTKSLLSGCNRFSHRIFQEQLVVFANWAKARKQAPNKARKGVKIFQLGWRRCVSEKAKARILNRRSSLRRSMWTKLKIKLHYTLTYTNRVIVFGLFSPVQNNEFSYENKRILSDTFLPIASSKTPENADAWKRQYMTLFSAVVWKASVFTFPH